MSKGSRFGKSMGDVLLKAMANKHDSGQDEESPLSKKQKLKLKNEIIEKCKAPTTPAPTKPNRTVTASRHGQGPTRKGAPSAKRTIPDNLFYNALKRSPAEIREEFRRSNTSVPKKKGMIEGVSHAYYALQNNNNRSVAAQQKILDYQVLLAELKDELKNFISAPRASDKPQSNPLPTKTPVRAQSSQEVFTTRTQFEDHSAGNGLIDVVVGFDFGTACSKIIIRTPYEGDLAYLVPFGDFAHSSNGYLLPTHISATNGAYYFPKTGKIGRYDNLKLEFIQSLSKFEEDDVAEYNVIAYFALVFQYVRNWFLKNCRENYPRNSLIWKVNIGVPSSTAENEDICRLYEKLVMVSWTLSTKKQSISARSVDEVKSCYQAEDLTEDEMVDVKIFPEVAAEVIGYTQSDLRQEGLHLMMDVGAGTLDICGFNVHQNDGENVLPIFSTNVEPHGVKSLHRVRCDAISMGVEACHDKLIKDVVAPVSNDLNSYIPRPNDLEQEVKDAEVRFGTRCSAQLRSVILDLKTRHVPRSDCWRSQIPLFLCGGGSKLYFYNETINKISDWMKSNENNSGIRIVALPRPDALADFVDEDNFHRFGVAWGLSHSPYDIDRVMTHIAPVFTDKSSKEDRCAWWERPTYYGLLDD